MKTVIRCSSLWPGRGPESGGPCSVTVEGGLIESIEPLSGNAPGCHAIPAFFDAHCHFSWMGLEHVFADLSDCRCAFELLERVREHLSPEPPGIIRGEKWDESEWDDERPPSIEELDAASCGRPVFLRRVCGHSALVNTPMLDMLVSRLGELPVRSGTSSALIVEEPVLKAFDLFPPSDGEMSAATVSATARAFAAGVTGICTTESPRQARQLAATADAALSISVCILADDPSQWPEASSSGRFLTKCAKIFLDGGLGAGTAAIEGAYRDGSTGLLLLDDDELEILVQSAWSRGLQPAMHAIGARALDQIRRVSVGLAGHPLGIRIEHAEQLARVWPEGWRKDLHFFSMQPNFVRRWQNPGGMYEKRLSDGEAIELNPFSLPLAAGFELGFGSDGMPFGPLWGLPGAISHPWRDYSLGRAAALEAYTLGAARISGFLDLAMPVSAGRRADLVLLSGDPLMDDPDSIRVLMTMAGGRVVFCDEALPEGSQDAV